MVLLVAMISVAWGWSSPQAEFLQTAVSNAPEEEVMGPNMHFAPVSTTMQCVISLTIQYMIVFTALGLCRSYLDFQGQDHSKNAVAHALKHASETVFYAPMTCLMFLGFRMRVLQLTKGEGNPQEWVQYCMFFVAYSILANTLLVLLVPIFTGKDLEVNAETGDLKDTEENPFSNWLLAALFTTLRYAALLALYAGFAGVVVGVFMFEPPTGVWEGAVPPLSPAVACTVALSTMFFTVYFLLAASRTYSQFTKGSTGLSYFEHTMSMAANTMGLAPMLCVLFLGARMRALQMDPVSGNPQRWAQNCFYTCTYALMAQTILSVAVPLVIGGKATKGRVEGDMEYEVPNAFLAKTLTVCRFVIMLLVYVAAFAVVCSVFTIKHPQGDELTPPLSPTMQCVVNLATQYFFIYLLLWIFYTVEDFTNWELGMVRNAIESAKTTVQFAPMLAVLFVGTRMRALQISKNQGAPQGWAQDGMYLATWAVFIQFLMCLVMPIFTGKTYTPDSLDGSTKHDTTIANPIGAWIVTIVRYLALLALYVGVVAVIVSVFLITPETANGRGAIPLVSDGTLGVNMAPKPSGLDSVPGATSGMEAAGSGVGTGVNTVTGA